MLYFNPYLESFWLFKYCSYSWYLSWVWCKGVVKMSINLIANMQSELCRIFFIDHMKNVSKYLSENVLDEKVSKHVVKCPQKKKVTSRFWNGLFIYQSNIVVWRKTQNKNYPLNKTVNVMFYLALVTSVLQE